MEICAEFLYAIKLIPCEKHVKEFSDLFEKIEEVKGESKNQDSLRACQVEGCLIEWNAYLSLGKKKSALPDLVRTADLALAREYAARMEALAEESRWSGKERLSWSVTG